MYNYKKDGITTLAIIHCNQDIIYSMIRRRFNEVTYQELKEKMQKSKVLQSSYAFSRNKLLKDRLW